MKRIIHLEARSAKASRNVASLSRPRQSSEPFRSKLQSLELGAGSSPPSNCTVVQSTSFAQKANSQLCRACAASESQMSLQSGSASQLSEGNSEALAPLPWCRPARAEKLGLHGKNSEESP